MSGQGCALCGCGRGSRRRTTPQEGKPMQTSSRIASSSRSRQYRPWRGRRRGLLQASPRSAPWAPPRDALGPGGTSSSWSWSIGAAWPIRASAVSTARPSPPRTPGVKVVQDSTGPSAGRIRSMVESGRVTWDICDSSATGANLLGGLGLATKMDYSDRGPENVIGPGFALDYGAAPYSFSTCWSTTAQIPDPADRLGGFLGHQALPRHAAAAARRHLRAGSGDDVDGQGAGALYPIDMRAGIKRVTGAAARTWSSGPMARRASS